MCGIIAVLRERDTRPALEPGLILQTLASVREDFVPVGGELADLADWLRVAATRLTEVDDHLRSMPGVRLLVHDPATCNVVAVLCGEIYDKVTTVEQQLDALAPGEGGASLEHVNAALIEVKDALWATERDRVRNARAIVDLGGGAPSTAAVPGLWSIQAALSSIDRLEVRGRDSAGLEVFVTGHGLSVDPSSGALGGRTGDLIFRSGAVRVVGDALAFVYKAAAEIGELGDNTAHIRDAITSDELLRQAMAGEDSHVAVIGHTRWASVGIISEPNAHPLDSYELDSSDRPYVAAVLNGDVDNFADLKAVNGLQISPEITTDAKVIPTLVARRLEGGDGINEAFRSAVASFEGSVAIAAHSASAPNAMMLALRGSGQALYVGLADGGYVIASEPYGVVEESHRYVRMDGETPADPNNPIVSQGQILVLDGSKAGQIAGISRVGYDGTELPVTEADLVGAEITTRDIDRGDFPHFLLKEIGEAPSSFRKTLRGKIADVDGSPRVKLSTDTLPVEVRERLAAGEISRIIAIGQGTAAVASRAIPQFLRPLLADRGVTVTSELATELSGFSMRDDMSDTLIVAVSQSGTTTDTNRTVDIVRARGGQVLSIVNRRGSDLTDKSDGVLYTSDGRDVEMSVASTKAFYAQIAAGALLSLAIADALGVEHDQTEIIEALRALPDAMAAVMESRPAIAAAAQRHLPSKRYWALVGNGPNRIAAAEIRIKLSELCYKAIPEDGTEDKKHIDLSSEPMILVCAAGLTGSTADDVAKEVAIYRAHKAIPIVIASEGEARFSAAVELITVPAIHPAIDFVLATMAGHLFGYEAALAIDAQARPLREMRASIELALESGALPESGFEKLRTQFQAPAGRFLDGLRGQQYDGHLEASTASRVAASLRYALGIVPLEAYQAEIGKVGTPGVVIEDLTRGLNLAIDELTRPVDAIKHQAKTVTVGISRTDETLLQSELVREAMVAGAARDRLSYRALRTLVALDAAAIEVNGFTRYRIEGDLEVEGEGEATIQVIDRGGIARDIQSRTESNPTLRGTKHRAAFEREVTVGKGRADGRTLIHIPEVKDGRTVGLTLLHVKFHDTLPASSMRAVMQGYRGRYGALKDAVTETEPSFRDDLLGDIDVVSLLTDPVYVLAEHWTS
ncbi:MAG: glucosamine--fructose-6-phosphate aminotransferase (isomerizing) [Candidatus Poriferisodalaceae bacterium]|jgi:glucosamine--fructose-6-phosphate aminotransferase (isomerizing)